MGYDLFARSTRLSWHHAAAGYAFYVQTTCTGDDSSGHGQKTADVNDFTSNTAEDLLAWTASDAIALPAPKPRPETAAVPSWM